MTTRLIRLCFVFISLVLTGCTGTMADDRAHMYVDDRPMVITYNSAKHAGIFKDVLPAFTQATGIHTPPSSLNSGEAIAALQREAKYPRADTVYVAMPYAQQLVDAGVVTAYRPPRSELIDPKLMHPEGLWTTLHTCTVAFVVNKGALKGNHVPLTWSDLTKPAYQGLVGMTNPTSSGAGYAAATAANLAMRGTLHDWRPGVRYLQTLHDQGLRIIAQGAAPKVNDGTLPILIDLDCNGYPLMASNPDIRVVIPKEGTVRVPFVVALVKGGPNPKHGRALLDYYLSEKGQELFARGFMEPAIGELPASIQARRLPADAYEATISVDYEEQGRVHGEFVEEYRRAMGK